MGYFQTCRDLEVIQKFRNEVFNLWKFENEVAKELHSEYSSIPIKKQQAIQHLASENPEYRQVRERISKIVLETSRVALRHGVSTQLKSFPAPAIGGPVIPVDVFYSVLHDTSHGGIDRQLIVDSINETIGECERDLKVEFRRMFNLFYWIKSVFVFIIRIPFMLISVSGFNVEEVEKHLISKLFKIAELGVLIYLFLKLGLSSQQLKNAIINLLTK